MAKLDELGNIGGMLNRRTRKTTLPTQMGPYFEPQKLKCRGVFFKAVHDFWMNLITTSRRDVTVMTDMMVRNEGESSPNDRTF